MSKHSLTKPDKVPGPARVKRQGNWNSWNAPGGDYIRTGDGDRRFIIRCIKAGKPIPPGLYHIEKTIRLP